VEIAKKFQQPWGVYRALADRFLEVDQCPTDIAEMLIALGVKIIHELGPCGPS
jgi:hypothetical protein